MQRNIFMYNNVQNMYNKRKFKKKKTMIKLKLEDFL